MIRVALLDDHPFTLQAVKMNLALEDDIDVVATFSDGRGLLGHLIDLSPDVFLTDLMVPNHDPLALVTALARELPETRVGVITGSVDVGLFRRLLAAGVRAIQLKGDRQDLAAIVRTLHAGERYLSDEAARRLGIQPGSA